MEKKKNGACGTPLWVWIISSVLLTIGFNSINTTGQSMGSIIFTSCLIGGMFGFIAFCFKMFTITSRKQKEARNQKRIDQANGITRYHSLMHVGGLNVPENLSCDVILSPMELKIACGGNEFSLQIGKIRNVDYQLDIDEKQYLKSSMAKGIIGAATFGVAGAVIGSAPKTKTKREVKCYAIIAYESSTGEYRNFILRDEYPNSGQCARLVDALRPRINSQVNKVEL